MTRSSRAQTRSIASYGDLASYVVNELPHHSLYSLGRMQEVWLDR